METEKSIKVSINIPEGLYRSMEKNALENERTFSAEVIYRARKFDQANPIILQGGVKSEVGTMVEPKKEDTKVDEEWIYDGLIAKIGESMDRDIDYDEKAELNKMVREAGLVWNTYAKRLEKVEDGKFKLIHQF